MHSRGKRKQATIERGCPFIEDPILDTPKCESHAAIHSASATQARRAVSLFTQGWINCRIANTESGCVQAKPPIKVETPLTWPFQSKGKDSVGCALPDPTMNVWHKLSLERPGLTHVTLQTTKPHPVAWRCPNPSRQTFCDSLYFFCACSLA